MKLAQLIIVFFLSLQILGQEDSTKTNKFEWGYSAAVHYSLLNVQKSEQFSEQVTNQFEIETQNGFGFGGGVSLFFPLSEKVTLNPYFHFLLNSVGVIYDFKTEPKRTQWIYSTAAEISVIGSYDLKSTAKTPTLLLGGSFIYWVEGIEASFLDVNPVDFAIRPGVGFKGVGEKSTLYIDVLFNIGLTNIVAQNSNLVGNAATSLIQRNGLTVAFHFH